MPDWHLRSIGSANSYAPPQQRDRACVTVITHCGAAMSSPCLIGLFLLAASLAASAATTASPRTTAAGKIQTTVYRCDQPGKAAPVFQSSPCSTGSQQRRLELSHRQPAAAVAAKPSRNKQKTRERKTAQRQQRSTRARTTPAPARSERAAFARKSRNARAQALQSSCPPTREDSGPTGSNSVGTAWKHYQSLPSRTYLKNAGKWPAHCPD